MSKAHVYLTFPFVLSWSMLEAMSLECLVIGSDTAPVKEVIEHEKNGLLVDFFSPEKITEKIIEVFEHKDNMQDMRKQARKTIVDNYDLKNSLTFFREFLSPHSPFHIYSRPTALVSPSPNLVVYPPKVGVR